MDVQLQKRIDLAAQSILDNEKLTADLDDATAQVLLDWGISCVNAIVRRTSGMNDLQAEDAMYPQMRALRRLMRYVNKLIARFEILGEAGQIEELRDIVEQAATIYGHSYTPPDFPQQQQTLSEIGGLLADQPGMVRSLRRLIENKKIM